MRIFCRGREEVLVEYLRHGKGCWNLDGKEHWDGDAFALLLLNSGTSLLSRKITY